jgi:hypothetical protein
MGQGNSFVLRLRSTTAPGTRVGEWGHNFTALTRLIDGLHALAPSRGATAGQFRRRKSSPSRTLRPCTDRTLQNILVYVKI